MKMLEKLREHLVNLSESDREELQKNLERGCDDIPKGWVSIEDHLPMFLAKDILQGYSVYKVVLDDNTEELTKVSDHNTWYYSAKESGITHWLNN